MDNKKIGIVMPSLGFGGAERVATSYANFVVNNTNNKVYIIKFDNEKSSYPLSDKVNVINYESKNLSRIGAIIDRFRFLKKNLKENNIDIIFAMFWNMELYSYFAKSRNCKLIGSERCNINEKSFFSRIFCRISSMLCDGFVFQTEKIKLLYPKSVIKKSIVIPNAVSNKDVFKINNAQKKDIITAMGRLDLQKGFDVLITAFSEVLKKHNNFKLVIYGEGYERQNLEALVEELGLTEKVFLPGTYKKAIEEISKSKIFVLSSRYEGMPNALIEAMAIGNACISTNCDFGPAELIENGKNGILINVDDKDELVKNINYLIENEDKRKELEKNAIKLREDLHPEKIYNEYYQFFSKTISKKKLAEKIKSVFKEPIKLISFLDSKGFLNFMSDKAYLKLYYRLKFNKKLDLKNPQTFNEKLQWLKLYDRNPEYTNMVDKYEVKALVSEKIGKKYIIPTLGVWDSFEDINFDELPNQFVLKCTHDSGGLIVCNDKAKLNIDEVRQKINKCLKHNYYYFGREWPYKNIKPRIIAEKYMEDSKTKELRDYKFFCFNGEVKLVFIATDRQSNEETKFDFFDENFKHLDFTNGHPNAFKKPEKPINFELMKKLASKLSKGIPQVRIDFYEVDKKVYFGEITFFHWSGLKPFEPEEWDLKFGKMIKLPNKKR